MPVSPYGESKFMIDMMLQSYHIAYKLDYVSFRYFNACGADPQGRHGQEPGATHIIARVLESIRDGQEFTLYGNNYPTSDGTCVRDYVHVDDIARAHALALYHKIPAGIYNLGSNQGTSNHEIIVATERVTGRQPSVTVGEIRAGDPPSLTASSTKFDMLVGAWRHHNLDEMIQHAWAWYNK
jgi:UDP-glucose 4-epimerase